jgi:Ca2+:H+ antiporter
MDARSSHAAARNFKSWGHYKVDPERVNNPPFSPQIPLDPESDRRSGFDWLTEMGWMRTFLVFVPIALAMRWLDTLAGWQFAAALLSLLPLAALMGEATEHLTHHSGPGIGGLLNATFGNAAELIIALALLFKGLDTAVKASITGSILGNLLLVLGASLLAGGLKYSTLKFNRTAAGIGGTMLVLAAMGLLVPAIFHTLPEVLALEDEQALNLEHELSLAVCAVLMLTYLASLVFSLMTHKGLYGGGEGVVNSLTSHGGGTVPPAVWSVRRAVIVLFATTAAIALISEILAGAIEHTGERLGLTQVFLGVVVVAIAGNAAEHSTAILVARKNMMDLSVGIALGSAQQIALFVAPVLVFASYLRPEPMDLLFSTMEIVSVILAVLIARMVAEDGESNWLEGVMLLMIYLILSMAFFVLPEPKVRHRAIQPAAASAAESVGNGFRPRILQESAGITHASKMGQGDVLHRDRAGDATQRSDLPVIPRTSTGRDQGPARTRTEELSRRLDQRRRQRIHGEMRRLGRSA